MADTFSLIKDGIKVALGAKSKDWPIFAIECESHECSFCLHGKLPEDAEVPLRMCIKHLDIACFVLDKANIPVASELF